MFIVEILSVVVHYRIEKVKQRDHCSSKKVRVPFKVPVCTLLERELDWKMDKVCKSNLDQLISGITIEFWYFYSLHSLS